MDGGPSCGGPCSAGLPDPLTQTSALSWLPLQAARSQHARVLHAASMQIELADILCTAMTPPQPGCWLPAARVQSVVAIASCPGRAASRRKLVCSKRGATERDAGLLGHVHGGGGHVAEHGLHLADGCLHLPRLIVRVCTAHQLGPGNSTRWMGRHWCRDPLDIHHTWLWWLHGCSCRPAALHRDGSARVWGVLKPAGGNAGV